MLRMSAHFGKSLSRVDSRVLSASLAIPHRLGWCGDLACALLGRGRYGHDAGCEVGIGNQHTNRRVQQTAPGDTVSAGRGYPPPSPPSQHTAVKHMKITTSSGVESGGDCLKKQAGSLVVNATFLDVGGDNTGAALTPSRPVCAAFPSPQHRLINVSMQRQC